ncbi:MAG: helix-turn-helix transcriptional regulator [Faecalibacterium sp.]
MPSSATSSALKSRPTTSAGKRKGRRTGVQQNKYRFREMRERAGMTQIQVATTLHFTPSTVCAWELGRNTPTIPTVLELMKLYGCTIDEILGIEKKEDSQ